MQTYRTRFGNWPSVLIAAGLASDGKIAARTRRVDWTSGQPLQHLRDASKELGVQRLRYEQYDAWRAGRIAQQIANNDLTAVATGHAICQHYDGWRFALVAAGLITARSPSSCCAVTAMISIKDVLCEHAARAFQSDGRWGRGDSCWNEAGPTASFRRRAPSTAAACWRSRSERACRTPNDLSAPGGVRARVRSVAKVRAHRTSHRCRHRRRTLAYRQWLTKQA